MIIDSKSMHLIGNPHEIKQDILKPYPHFFMNHLSFKKNEVTDIFSN